MLPKRCQNVTNMEPQIHPKLFKRFKGKPRRRQKISEMLNKCMPKTKAKKGAKMEPGRRYARGNPKAYSRLIRLTSLTGYCVSTAGAPQPGRAVLSPQSGSHGAPHRGEPARKTRDDELLHAVKAEEPIEYTHIGYPG